MSNRNYYVICDDNCKFQGMTKEQILAAIAEATGNVPSAVEDAFIEQVKPSGENVNLTFWFGTQAEYNALSPAPTTNRVIFRVTTAGKIYAIKDDDTVDNLPTGALTTAEINTLWDAI